MSTASGELRIGPPDTVRTGPLTRPRPALWWTKRWPYTVYILRELSSVFVGIYALLLLLLVYNFAQGRQAYTAYLDFLQSPGMFLFHLVALAFSLLHTITWFNLTPKAMAIWRGEERLPPMSLVAPNYVLWVVVSAIILWLVAR